MVGMTGLEPAASCSQSRRATKLRYIPALFNIIVYFISKVKIFKVANCKCKLDTCTVEIS